MTSSATTTVKAKYEHPYLVRLCHWLSAISITAMVGSGIEIFRAFPSFGAKIPERDIVGIPAWAGFGDWLGGALQIHFTFMWLFAGAGFVYAISQAVTRNYKQVLFSPSDIDGVWPMFRHYFLRDPKPVVDQSYNPLQKLAYTIALLLGAFSLLTGVALYKPAQLHLLLWLLGGFQWVRFEHFMAMIGLLSFIPGHLIMVAIHGWANFASMLYGWKLERSVQDR